MKIIIGEFWTIIGENESKKYHKRLNFLPYVTRYAKTNHMQKKLSSFLTDFAIFLPHL